MAKTAHKEKEVTPAGSDDPKNVVKGEDGGHDVFHQAREARGEAHPEEGVAAKDEESSKAVSLSKQAAEADYTDAMKKADLAKEAREEHLKANGIDPNAGGLTPGGKKVEASDHKGKLYVGPVTCESVHGQTHEKISFKFELPTPSGEGFLKNAFLEAHPEALVNEYFTIDEKNESDPNLRSRYE